MLQNLWLEDNLVPLGSDVNNTNEYLWESNTQPEMGQHSLQTGGNPETFSVKTASWSLEFNLINNYILNIIYEV